MILEWFSYLLILLIHIQWKQYKVKKHFYLDFKFNEKLPII